MFGVACHNGVETPISPSTTTESVPAATSAALADEGDTATTRGGPISFPMNEIDGSGFSARAPSELVVLGFGLRRQGKAFQVNISGSFST